LDPATIDVGADIEFEIDLGAIYFYVALTRRYERLGHIVTAEYLPPYPACELVATVRGFAAITGGGFEE
jgi:hypothetical protein